MASRALGTSVVLAVAVASAVVGPPAAQALAPSVVAAAASAGPRDDFNGDGYADLAFSAPGATVNGFAGAGYAGVVYGSSGGLKTTTKQVVTQNSAGVPGVAEAGDAFSSTLVSADLDRDGYTDLVVGSAGEQDGTAVRAGALSVLWGSAAGLSGGATLLVGAASSEVGSELAVGDFDGDGAKDLATFRSEDLQVLRGPFARTGAAAAVTLAADTEDNRWHDLAAGDVDGDGRDDLVGLAHNGNEDDRRRVSVAAGGPSGPGAFREVTNADGRGLEAGENLAVGNVNGDGYADFVVGRLEGYDSDAENPLALGGMITYVPGGATGAQGAAAKVFNQDSAGVPGAAERGDLFGSSLAIGDTDGDGYGEVAAGVPGEALGTTARAGGIVILPGTAAGPTGTGSTGFNQDTEGVTGTAELGDLFGGAAAFVDGNRNGRAELAVGAPGENAGEGSLWVFPSMTTGTGSFTFGHGTLGTVAVKAALGSSFNR
ncbi:VCBS repeat-containing protein [Streptomyces sp. NBC_00234]|uniref:VCBS repeat-containing protein n=1 Tax=Streptomyces sp. NBC_00234 TaxID=2903638 RepID=UPI002E2A0C94|nr:FG-GAP-like repeat-containing protein [Streptomyces sp. NBC_00234]